MAILEKIKEAENKVEQMKLNAKEEVNKKLIKNNEENNTLIQNKMNEANKIIENNKVQTSKKIIELEHTKNEECKNICLNDEKKALNHQKQTIDFIVKKVIDS